ncbi:hypothetical protein BHE74_00040494, partial [Ensete ventricosum]
MPRLLAREGEAPPRLPALWTRARRCLIFPHRDESLPHLSRGDEGLPRLPARGRGNASFARWSSRGDEVPPNFSHAAKERRGGGDKEGKEKIREREEGREGKGRIREEETKKKKRRGRRERAAAAAATAGKEEEEGIRRKKGRRRRGEEKGLRPSASAQMRRLRRRERRRRNRGEEEKENRGGRRGLQVGKKRRRREKEEEGKRVGEEGREGGCAPLLPQEEAAFGRQLVAATLFPAEETEEVQ